MQYSTETAEEYWKTVKQKGNTKCVHISVVETGVGIGYCPSEKGFCRKNNLKINKNA